MINTRRNMIIVKGVIRTSQIKFCQYNPTIISVFRIKAKETIGRVNWRFSDPVSVRKVREMCGNISDRLRI